MDWLIQNFMVIVFLVCIIFMFAKFIYGIYKTIKDANEEKMLDQVLNYTPIISKFISNNERIDVATIKATFIDLCNKKYILVNPIIDERGEIEDFELINNGIPKFKEEEYKKNLFNKELIDSDINLSYLYVFNKYIFENQEKELFSALMRKLELRKNIIEDEMLKAILFAELYNENIIKKNNNGNDFEEFTEKGAELLNNVKAFEIFLEKFNFNKCLKANKTEEFENYILFAVMFGIENLDMNLMRNLYMKKTFNS